MYIYIYNKKILLNTTQKGILKDVKLTKLLVNLIHTMQTTISHKNSSQLLQSNQ